MAIKANASITLSFMVDVKATYRYYKLQASTASAPTVPTTAIPSGWTDTEPTYTEGSTSTLYFVDKTVFTNDTFAYSAVSKSTSYEAAKSAYNKAVAANNTANNVQQNLDTKIPMINGTHTAASYIWTGVAPFSELKDGQKITYWLTYGVSGSRVSMPYWKDANGSTQQGTNEGAVLNLTLPDGSTTGNVACYYGGANRINSQFPQGNAIELTYKKLVKIGSYYYTGWWANANYNSDTIDNRIAYFTGKTGTKGIWARSLFMEDGFGTYQNICTASDGTVTTKNITSATTKKANTNGFKIGSNIYYTNTTYNANTNITGYGVIYSSFGSLFDSRYSLNTTLTANCLTPYKPIYLVGSVSTDGLFYLDDIWWSQTPTTEGKIYVLLGSCYDSTTSNCRITLYEKNPWYICTSDGTLQEYYYERMNSLISNVDVEYYLSTSSTSLSDGSWVTTAPDWVNGKYMWSRTKTIDGAGNVSYSPSQNGTCIAGATGATGTGISSITEEYYLSKSKTTQTGGSWTTTPPTWSKGTYIWTRSKIVYINPSSTKYTTPLCDSSWEAVNEIKVGGTNLATLTNRGVSGWNWSMKTGDYTKMEVIENNIRCCKLTRGSVEQTGWSVIYYRDIGRSKYKPGTEYTISFEVKASVNTVINLYLCSMSGAGSLTKSIKNINRDVTADIWTKCVYVVTTYDSLPSETNQVLYLYGMNSVAEVSYVFRNLMIEEGTIPTSWSPAPEDVESDITDASKSATNYIKFEDGIGLIVGNMTETTLGKNTLMDDNGLAIRNNTTELARFTENGITFSGKSISTSGDTVSDFIKISKVIYDAPIATYAHARIESQDAIIIESNNARPVSLKSGGATVETFGGDVYISSHYGDSNLIYLSGKVRYDTTILTEQDLNDLYYNENFYINSGCNNKPCDKEGWLYVRNSNKVAATGDTSNLYQLFIAINGRKYERNGIITLNGFDIEGNPINTIGWGFWRAIPSTKLLWTNPNPTTQMGTSTITLQDEITGYDMIKIVTKQYNQSSYRTFEGPADLNSSIAAMQIDTTTTSGVVSIITRIFTITEATKITVGTCYRQLTNAARASDTQYLIPYKIYGVICE